MHPELQAELESFEPETLRFVSLWAQYERGFLLYGGGIADQPGRYIEAMEILSAEVGRRERIAFERRHKLRRSGFGDSGAKPLQITGMAGAKVQRVI